MGLGTLAADRPAWGQIPGSDDTDPASPTPRPSCRADFCPAPQRFLPRSPAGLCPHRCLPPSEAGSVEPVAKIPGLGAATHGHGRPGDVHATPAWLQAEDERHHRALARGETPRPATKLPAPRARSRLPRVPAEPCPHQDVPRGFLLRRGRAQGCRFLSPTRTALEEGQEVSRLLRAAAQGRQREGCARWG